MKIRRRTLSSLVILLALIAGAVAFIATRGDDGTSLEVDRTYVARVGSVGPDAFSTSYATATATGPFAITSGEIDSSSDQLYVIPGRTYGGSGGNVCDKQGMIDFFALHPDRALAWARVQKIGVSEIPAFLDSLKPMILAQNVKVTMFGFHASTSYGYAAVLEAGTAVLVDADGLPRARCACGNPVIATKDPVKTAQTENKRLKIDLALEEVATTTIAAETTTTATEVATSTSEAAGTSTTMVEESTTTLASDTTVQIQEESTTTTTPDTTVVDCPNESTLKIGDAVADANGDLWVREDTGYWPLKQNRPPVSTLGGLPGYSDNCAPCIDVNVGRDGVIYVDPDGIRWVSEFASDGTIYWRSSDSAKTTAELTAMNPKCNPCPPVNAITGTTYTDSDGTKWTMKEGRWFDPATGKSVTYLSDIPGYTNDCDPCSTDSATYQRDSAGLPITKTIPTDSPVLEGTVVINPNGPASPIEVDDARITQWVSTGDDCTLPCPSADYTSGAKYVDENGDLWTYDGSLWVNARTGTKYSLLRDLPGWTNNCNPCPPKEGAADGTTYVDIDGVTWTLTNGRWTSPDGKSVTYASDIRGWNELCNMPPCPPYVSTGAGGQVKDADGVIWTWEHNGWTSPTGQRRYTVREFPGCNPCPPSERAQWTDGMSYLDTNGITWTFENGGWSGPAGKRVYTINMLPGCGDVIDVPRDEPVSIGPDQGSTSASGSPDTTTAPETTVAATAPVTTAAAAPETTAVTAAPTTVATATTVAQAATTTTPKATTTTVKATTTTVKATTTTAVNAAAPAITVNSCSGLGEGMRVILSLVVTDVDGIDATGFSAVVTGADGSRATTSAAGFTKLAGADQYQLQLVLTSPSFTQYNLTINARDARGRTGSVSKKISATAQSGYITCL